MIRKLSTEKYICVGLDIDIERLPVEYSHLALRDKIISFSREIVLLTKDIASAYKINKAFIDFYGDASLLKELVQMIRKIDNKKLIFIDCKIGDIANTMKFYLKNIFDYIDADGVVINPYMGGEVFESLKFYKDKYFLILVRTSGTKSNIIQDLPVVDQNNEVQPLWKIIFKLIFNELPLIQTIPIISEGADLSWVAENLPKESHIFYAGAGKQGSNLNKLMPLLVNRHKSILINSSRAILYPYEKSDKDWRTKVSKSIEEFNCEINLIKRGLL